MPPELRGVVEPAQLLHADGRWQRPRLSGLWTYLVAILAPSAAFFALVMPGLTAAGIVWLPVLSAALFAMATVLMALTSFTEPGIVPAMNQRREDVPPHAVVNGHKVALKYCAVCGIARPPRASHCRETDRCIEKWDHYCPWVGTAVGRRNHRWFVGFVLATTCLAALVTSGSLRHLWGLAAVLEREATLASPPPPASPMVKVAGLDAATIAGWPVFARAAVGAPASCVLLGYCAVVSILLGMLSAYHLYLIATNQTTYEHVRGAYDTTPNPFNRGCIGNIGEFLCPACFPPPRCVYEVDSEAGGRSVSTELQAAACSSTGRPPPS